MNVSVIPAAGLGADEPEHEPEARDAEPMG